MQQLFFMPGMLRLLLALTVVVDHGTRIDLGAWAVYMFFCLSGYWVTVMYRSKYSQYTQPVRAFYLSRYLRLLPVYLLCQTLMIISLAVEGAPTIIHGIHGVVWCLRTLLIASAASQPVYLVPSWTLDLEVQFYLLFPILAFSMSKCPERYRLFLLYGITAVAIIFDLTQMGSRSTFVLYYLCFFLLGVCNGVKPWKPTKLLAVSSIVA